MSELKMSGGGKLKFFAHKNNYTKHLVNLIRQYITAEKHGDNVGDEVNGVFEMNITNKQIDTILLLKTGLKIYRDINGISMKSIDSSFIKIPVIGNSKARKRLKDSIDFLNKNQRSGNKYWLKNN